MAEPDAERLGEIVTLEALACGELEDELIACIEPRRRLTHGSGQLLEIDGAEPIRRGVVRSHDFSGRRRIERAHPLATLRASIHLVTKDGEQPWLQLVRVAELAKLLGGLDEHVLYDVGCLVPIVQHVGRRVVERIGVAVVDPGQSDRVAGEVRRHQFGVAPTVHHRPLSHPQPARWNETMAQNSG